MVHVLYLRIGAAICFFFAAWLGDLYFVGFFRRKAAHIKTKSPPPHERKRREPPQTKAEIVSINIKDKSAAEIVSQILNATLNLMEIQLDESAMEGVTDSYRGVTGDFCEINFENQKQDPTSVPMFRHVGQKSPACLTKRYRVNLKDVVQLAREQSAANVRVLPLAGAIFHESRCGSTTIGNALQAMDPKAHRVYSEAQPEIAANLCGDSFQLCSIEQAVELFTDVVYLMSRTNDAQEERVFFKFHSDNSRNIKVFQQAFPTTPWLFVYRDPVHIIVSQFKEGRSIAKCVRVTNSKQLFDIAQRQGFEFPRKLTKELSCAATLASYCEAAIEAKQATPDLGTLVHYPDLPDVLIDDVFPNKFGLSVTAEQEELIRSISSMYSKASHGRSRPFADDSMRKDAKATKAIRDAVTVFAQEPYRKLQALTAGKTLSAEEGSVYGSGEL